MDGKHSIWIFGAQYRGKSKRDNNFVGEALWNGESVIYKFSKSPNWQVM